VNNTQTKARPFVKRNGKHSNRAAKGRGKRMKIDWAFRRLRNQTVRFFAGADRELRRALTGRLESARTYSQIEHEIMNELGPRKGARTWHQFMDTFFGHRINKMARQ
jgi:hypothetical protein